MNELPRSCDVAIVGAGAAGLATAVFAGRSNRSRSLVLLDSARRPGAKILVSGGTRCNVTNVTVTEHDFWGGRASVIRRVLRAFPVPDTVAFFRDLGVPLHEEAGGKLFPDTNRARDVLDALLRETERVGATMVAGHRVLGVERSADGFRVVTDRGDLQAAAVVLATGGQSLPKSGSDGAGFAIAKQLGHTIVPTTPALDPLVLARDERVHTELSGVSQDVELAVWIDGAIAVRVAGALLWTHIGASGPVALNVSRHWLRARLEGRTVSITANLRPGEQFGGVEAQWISLARDHPKAWVQTTLAAMVPASAAAVLLRELAIDGRVSLAHFPREDRRRLSRALVEWPLPVVGTRGYTYAEATAGGVALTEIDPATMESRVCPGLFLVGEMLDVDGRLGGFNFQWAWSSGFVAGRALAAASTKPRS
jgi:predicted Rossmann fold flavoprotein